MSKNRKKTKLKHDEQNEDEIEVGAITDDDIITPENMLAGETDTVLGGESLYCTEDDEIIKGKDLKLKAKDFVTKIPDNYKERMRAM